MKKTFLIVMFSFFMCICAFAEKIKVSGGGGSGSVSDAVYGAGWNGDTTTAPSKNAVYDKIETLGGGHDAVTLGVDADVLLGLSTQQLTLDGQAANIVFAGPGSGAAADPTFRALVDNDIPDTITASNYQLLDADLTAIAALGFTSTAFLKKTAADTWALDTSTYLTTVGTGTINELTYWSGANTLGTLAVATYPSLAELAYVKGVTSAIQTQLNAKQGTLTNSAGLAAALDDEAGTGAAVFATNPSFVGMTNTGAYTQSGTSANAFTGTPTFSNASYSALFTGGNVGIGTTAPTATLHLKAGTITANTAPLKFTSGLLNTAPEAGAIEFLTDDYYGTITTGAARKKFYIEGGTDVAVADGGTGKSSWTQYLIPYADTTTSFSQVAIGTSGQVLTSNGAGAAPTFQAVSGGVQYTDTRFYFGTFTRDMTAATGNVAYTGIGFTPKIIYMMATQDSAEEVSWGLSDGASSSCIYQRTGGVVKKASTLLISLRDASSANSQGAYVASLDADGFTLTWEKTGSPTGTAVMYYLAFR